MNGLWVFVAVLLSWLKLLGWMDFWFQERLINIKSIAWKCEDLNLQILMCLNEWSWFGSLYELICFEVFKCPIWCEIKTRSACMMVGNFANISIWNFSEEILFWSDDVLIPLVIWFGWEVILRIMKKWWSWWCGMIYVCMWSLMFVGWA